MRYVERPDQPPEEYLEVAEREFERARNHYQPPGQAPDPAQIKTYKFGAYKNAHVKKALHELFHGKCAYCEAPYASVHPMDVEHYRPKGAVAEDENHPGYWWLAMEWSNLFPSCIDCNRRRKQITPSGDVRQVKLQEDAFEFSASERQNGGKMDSFPLAPTGTRLLTPGEGPLSEEQALLLNPCEPNPGDHLEYYFDKESPVSFLLPKKLPEASQHEPFRGDDDLSLKGATSIHVYGLNRLDLVQARTEVLRRLEFLEAAVVTMLGLAEQMEAEASSDDDMLSRGSRLVRNLAKDTIAEMARMGRDAAPFSAMVQAWLKDFRDRVAP